MRTTLQIFFYLLNNHYRPSVGFRPSFYGLIVFLCLFTSHAWAQASRIQVKALNAEQVIRLLEREFQLTFNFSHDLLPSGQFSFSAEGKTEELVRLSFSILNRKIVALDQGVYAIQQQPIDPDQRIAPLIIQGTVSDIYKNPLIGASVWIPGLEKACTTNTQGEFYLKGYFADTESIEFRYLGYETLTKSVGQLKTTTKPHIMLSEQTHILGEVIIQDFLRWRSLPENIGEEVLLPDQLMPLAGRVDQDMLSVVQLLPGLYSSSESITELQTRGGTPDQTNFAWNDIPLFQTSHFFGKISSINPFMVNQIAIIRNGGSAEDSGQASGSIQMQSESQQVDSLSIQLHSNLLYSNIGLQLPILQDKVSLRAAWRQSYTQFFESLVYDHFFDQTFQFGKVIDEEFYREFYDLTELVTLNPRLSFKDLSANLNIQLSPKDLIRFSGLHISNQTDYVKSGEILGNRPTDELQYTNTGSSLSYQRKWSEDWNSQFRWSTSRFNNDYLYLEDPDSLDSTNETRQTNEVIQRMFSLTTQFSQPRWDIRGGVETNWLGNSTYFGGRSGSEVEVYYAHSDTARETSVFLQLLLKPFSWGQLESGWRWSMYSLSEEKIREPRFHLSLFPIPNWTIHAHLGWYHQVLHQRNLFTYLQPENGFWYLSNTQNIDYRPILRNQQWSLGLRYQNKGWTISADVYRKQLSDLWSSALDFDILEDPYQFSAMDISGLELALQYDQNWFSLLWTYDYIRESLQLWDETSVPSPFVQPHRLSLFQAFRWKQFTLSLHWRLASGRLFSVPNGLDSYIDDFGREQLTLGYDELLTEQTPSYHNLDMSIQYAFGQTSNKVFGKLGLSINNVYNRANIIRNFYYVNYNIDPVAPSLLSRQGLPFTPNLSLELFLNP